MKLTISAPILVHAPEMNEAISHWGVYAIPRMWRVPSGELVVRFNGEEDSSDFDNLHRAPNLYFTSRDSGYTWSAPRKVADSSVTPHIIALGDALIAIYGRPGVHIKYSEDHGETWSEPYTIIGKTLTKERDEGRSDFASKYGAPYSYANTFWDYISDNEIILLYNDLRYPDKNGVPTKAAFVKKIKVTKE